VVPGDTLVVIDDSIVRGTTLRESIVTMLARLEPARIIVASSAPPILYPDCYGIDMSQLGRFIAFEAAIALLTERGMASVVERVEERCLAQAGQPADRMRNEVRALYEPFTLDELSAKVSELIRTPGLAWRGRLDVIYQSVEGLRAAMPRFTGDWYFTGDYPTPGGLQVLNNAFLNWRRGDERRSY
jgi:amidophosphoribosyltransferase